MQRRDLLKTGLALGTVVPEAVAQPATMQTLRIGMTTSDLPTTGGIPDNGSEVAGSPAIRSTMRW